MPDLVQTITLNTDLPTLSPPLPQALENCVYSVVDATHLQLGWIDPGVFALHYEIEVSTSPAFTSPSQYQIPSNPESGSIYTVTVSNTMIAHYIRIRATNNAGASAWVSFTAV